jgi:PTH1 family peptidyl-tRNA hydrolase
VKYLIIGLGNIGSEYENTRHNIGFNIVEYLAKTEQAKWENDNFALTSEIKHKGRTLILIKPTTYMNLSGKAVNYHLNKHKVLPENMIVILDDLNLDFGVMRLREKGSDGGHNGLKSIDQVLNGNQYSRMRIGIGNKFHKGQQANFVLGKWNKEEEKSLEVIIEKAAEACKSFVAIGIKLTSNTFNGNLLDKEN